MPSKISTRVSAGRASYCCKVIVCGWGCNAGIIAASFHMLLNDKAIISFFDRRVKDYLGVVMRLSHIQIVVVGVY